MADKRQRARVQGSWAGHSKTAATAFQAGRRTSENVARTHWPSKEQAAADRRFVFQDPTEVQRKIPEERIIDKEGLYEISSGPTGISRLHLKPGFIESKEADWMFEQLYREIPWQQKSNIGQDGPYQEPRLTAWYGQLPYTYSGSTMKSNPHWHPLLSMLKDHIEELTGYTFNSLLCNLYRNCKDSIDWHSDDEPSLGRSPVIASLSFGETRNFEMRKKPPPVYAMVANKVFLGFQPDTGIDYNQCFSDENGRVCHQNDSYYQYLYPAGSLRRVYSSYMPRKHSIHFHNGGIFSGVKGGLVTLQITAQNVRQAEEKGNYTYAERIRIPLSHGCLLIMEGSTQKDWQHRVPKEYHDRNPRINLTFRTVYPEA